MNELISDEAVYRTAPATPGPLNMQDFVHELFHILFIDECLAWPNLAGQKIEALQDFSLI